VQQQKSSHPPQHTDAERTTKGKSHHTGTVAALCAAWEETKSGHGRHTRPVRDLTDVAGTLQPHQLHEGHIEGIVARWKQQHAPATVKSNRDGLAALLKFIGRTAGITDLQTMVPKVRDPGPRTTILQPGELARLLTHATPPMRLILTLATSLGLRLKECLTAAPAGYNRENHTITVTTKGRKLHTLPTTPQVEAILDTVPTTENPMTPYAELLRGRPMSTHAAHHAWASLKKKAQVNPNLIIHDLRRSAAVTLYELSRDLRAVEHLLGHESMTTTGRYLEHRDPERLRPLLAQMWTPKKGEQVQ
jgi:integrase/recombinase XerC/integrase/recombinase XerD